ncbi:hypothetical protein AB6A40_006010 [Gnathostoma spinigerum]|uniref:Uncharacterized protein n=1 Tax=Gnathostoma spinigerum TaxID=75299 RepID=A0ABD6EPE7_9BILA
MIQPKLITIRILKSLITRFPHDLILRNVRLIRVEEGPPARKLQELENGYEQEKIVIDALRMCCQSEGKGVIFDGAVLTGKYEEQLHDTSRWQ